MHGADSLSARAALACKRTLDRSRGAASLTIYSADYRTLAWSDGPAEDLGPDRLRPANSLFVAEGTLGLRLVHVRALRAGDRLVGSVRARLEGPSLHIGRLAVAPDQQGRGLGALLLARAEQVAEAKEALLFTGHRSVSNLRLYARAGYVEQRRAAVDDRVTLVFLRKMLS